MIERMELEIGGRTLTIETGKVAGQADGAVTVHYGETVVLAPAMAAAEVAEDQDFFPLTVDYREKAYAAGKIPGGFFKREGRPSEKEVLSSRLIDRPLRPLFPENYLNEVQILVTVLSSDQENDSDILGINGASAALAISTIPLQESIGGVRIGRVKGELIVNPTNTQLQESDLNIIVAGTKDNIIMVEGGAKEIAEDVLISALVFGHQEIKGIITAIEELAGRCGKPKAVVPPKETPAELAEAVKNLTREEIKLHNLAQEKHHRKKNLDAVLEKAQAQLKERFPEA